MNDLTSRYFLIINFDQLDIWLTMVLVSVQVTTYNNHPLRVPNNFANDNQLRTHVLNIVR